MKIFIVVVVYCIFVCAFSTHCTANMSQKYKDYYHSVYPFITSSTKGPFYATCTLCKCDISVSHGGLFDIKMHTRGKRHSAIDAQLNKTKSLFNMGVVSTKRDTTSISAECMMVGFFIEHNLPLSLADHLTPLIQNMFPGEETAKKFACRRTKSTCIVHEMARDSKRELLERMKCGPFSISTDGSADQGGKKQLYPLVIRYYNNNVQKVVTEILSIPSCKGDSTGENIFQLMDNELSSNNVPWSNVICFCCDNANVMKGEGKGVAGYIHRKNEHIFMNGCTCHLINLAAQYANDKLVRNVGDLVVDIFYYLKGSSKRSKVLEQFQESCGVNYQKFQKYCATRWLSLGQCVTRILDQWAPLAAMFDEEARQISSRSKRKASSTSSAEPAQKKVMSSSSKVTSSHKSHSNSSSHATSHKSHSNSSSHGKPKSTTLHSTKHSSGSKHHGSTSSSKESKSRPSSSGTPEAAQKTKSDGSGTKAGQKPISDGSKVSGTPTSSKSKTRFQATGRVERIHKGLSDPLMKLTSLFLRATIPLFDSLNLVLQRDEPCIQILQTKSIGLLTDFYVRFVKSEAIRNAKDIFSVDYKEKANQKNSEDMVIGVEARTYLDEKIQKGDISSDQAVEFYSSVKLYYTTACNYILKQFPLQDDLLRHAEVVDIQKRGSASFVSLEYFITRFPILLPSGSDKQELQNQFLRFQIDKLNISVSDRIDEQWSSLVTTYPLLSKVMLGILSIPHSNADSERVFSVVKRIHTDFRPNLDLPLLESLITVKTQMSSRNCPCYKMSFSSAFLVKAKSATYRDLQADKLAREQASSSSSEVGPDLADISGDILRMLSLPSGTGLSSE